MAEIALVKRVKYAGDVYKRLLECGFDIDNAVLFLEGIPDADVAPVRHGRWEKRKYDYYGLAIIKCSVCSEEWYFEVDSDVVDLSYHYCPNCGADMREKEGE